MSEILTDRELQSYLDEIMEDSSANQQGLAEEIAKQHLKEQDELRALDIKLGSVEKTEYERTSHTKGSAQQKYERRKKAEREAVHEALNQTYLDLNSVISVDDKKVLLELLAQGYTDNMNKYSSYIEHTFDVCFRRFIPNELLKMWEKYPETMVPFPGFEYKCTKEFGEEKTYYVSLDLPMYFRPEICTTMFQEHCKDKVMRVDKSIVMFYYHKKLKAETQVRYAKTLASIVTFYQLLKKKTYWYSLLIEYLKKKNNWTWDDLF